MAQKYRDSAKAEEQADIIARLAGRNLQAALNSFRACLQVIHNTKRMLEVDPECNICVQNPNSGAKWERRRQLYEAAEHIEDGVGDLLNHMKANLANTLVSINLPAHEIEVGNLGSSHFEKPTAEDDDDLLWCDRVCVHEKVEMDSTVWCNLPPTIMELVFARLPLPQMFQLRVLSKQWRYSITSATFQNAFGSTPTRRTSSLPGLSAAGDPGLKRLLSFATSERRWYSLPFSFPDDLPMAGDGGLLFYRRFASFPSGGNQGAAVQDLQLYVCNPLTRAWRKLPLPSYVAEFSLVHLVLDRQTKQYTITVVDDSPFLESKASLVEVYDSATNTWNASDGIFKSSGNNLIYYKCYGAGGFEGIRAYDKNTGQTSIPMIAVPAYVDLAEGTGFYTLAEYEGEIYVLQTEMDCSGIWVLQGPKHTWEKLCSVPKPEILKFYLFSLFVSGDVTLIFGDRRDYYDDDFIVEDPELRQLCPPHYMWMLDRSQGKWVDMSREKWVDYARDLFSFSDILCELRLDDVP